LPDTAFILPADPKASYLQYKTEIDEAVRRVLESGWYIGGEEVSAFEREFADYLGVGHALGVGSGTEALHLALRACGVGPGDRVMTVSHTAVATVAAVELAGAEPVFVDVAPEDFTMAPERLAAAVEENFRTRTSLDARRLKAVIPVHLYGHPAALREIVRTAETHGVYVIEDCAQAHGAALSGVKVGAWGHIAAFSFYPTKNLGALGDAGAVATGDPALAERARLLREYGWRERYVSEVPGMNTRMDPIQAAVLRVKLARLDEANDRRREIARAYDEAFSAAPLKTPVERPGCRHVYHQYVIRCVERDRLREHLRAASVGSLVHYPLPVHLQPAYRGRIAAPEGSLSNTEAVCAEILSLPVHPELSDEQQRQVADSVLAFHRR